ncbi:ABC transporter substrate-binding protein [Azospirillum picis]|uniref:ABC-type nitrate/sulfonate/bicarbonate transport system substrate-binding protein n=1 Tax=Azospirillum picis TaxID=488438 RepID=A0ABU0MMW3_9PROT|nr:ABC transporter substrate-binding protein [Azospirillum picis]MBP2301235.1 ABC-type nitrate/sulfonate/bicarbonate transport system substrate-binding protein [Azospirillum picis]MDQ0534802.1 ABC-type nitrate/sulfonate/bicarbonate transport system substrate-binding protein [Azospirillum picis]
MTLNRREILKGASAGLLLASVGPLGARAADALTIVMPSQLLLAFADILFTQAAGHFERQGLEVRVEEGRGSAMALQQVMAGNALVGRIGAVDHIRASAKQAGDLVAIGTVQQSSPWFVVSSPDRPVRTPQDMPGRTIGIQSVGGTTEILLDMMLLANGVDRAAVQRVVVGNSPAGVDLIDQKRIDAYFVTPSIAVALRLSGRPVDVWNTDDVLPTPGFCYSVRREVLDRQGETLHRFIAAVRAAVSGLVDGTVSEADALDALSRFDIAEARDRDRAMAIYRENLRFLLAEGRENLLRNVPSRWRSAYDVMVSGNYVPGGLDPSAFYTNRFVDVR